MYDFDDVMLISFTSFKLEKLVKRKLSKAWGKARDASMQSKITLARRRNIEPKSKEPRLHGHGQRGSMQRAKRYQNEAFLYALYVMNVACMQQPPSIEDEGHPQGLDSASDWFVEMGFSPLCP